MPPKDTYAPELTRRIVTDDADDIYSADATDHELRIAVDHSRTGIAWLSADGIFREVRAGYARMLGYTTDEMTGASWALTVPEEDQPAAVEAVHEMLDKGRSEVVVRARRKDGSLFYKKLLLVKTVDEQGEHNGHYCLMHDVTQRKLAEAALKRSHQFSDRLLDVIQDGVSVVDADGRHIKVNQAFLDMTGFSESEILGVGPPHPYWPDEHRDAIASIFELQPHGQRTHELIFKRRNGQRFPVLVTPSTTIDDRGQLIHIATVKDISDRKEGERRLIEAQRLKTMGTLAGGLAHDLNNLLTPVLGYADALMKGLLDVDEAAGEIHDAAARARQLVDRVLRFSRRDSAGDEPVGLIGAVADALQFARTSLPPNVKIETRFEAVRDKVACAEAEVQQVVLNLMANASYAMRDEGGTLTLHVFNPDDDTVALEVADTGCGIPAEMQDRMFEPFFTTKPASDGTGLGLATVRRVVEEAGGRVAVTSTPGEGTSFDIRLPLGRHRAAAAADRPGGEAAPLPGKTVMVIDDDDAVRDVTETLLRQLGHEVLSFANVADALAAHSADVDLVLTDYRMEGETGLDFVERAGDLRAPVILMTGDRDSLAGCPTGIAHRLAKPFSLDELERAIATVTPAV